MTNEELYQACLVRRSRRAYRDTLPDEALCRELEQAIDSANTRSGLRFSLVREGKKVLSSFAASYGFFSGAISYITVAGPDTDQGREDAGYYGELLLLRCVHLGLGTCWVGGTYNSAQVRALLDLPAGYKLFAIIAVGYVNDKNTGKETLIYKMTHRRTKSYRDMLVRCEGELPEEMRSALQFVEGAPSGVNRQPCRFAYEGGILSISAPEPITGKCLDLGIAKLHFEVGYRHTGRDGSWDGRRFIVSDGTPAGAPN